jgi:hypothetical protein
VVRSNLIEDLQKRQSIIDKREEEKHNKEMELLSAQIESAKKGIGANLPSGTGSSGYSRLEQKKKEKTRGTAARREGLQKARNKGVNQNG